MTAMQNAGHEPIRFRQGHLDSLCGAYALINAFSHMSRGDVFPAAVASFSNPGLSHETFDHKAGESLFSRLMMRKLGALQRVPPSRKTVVEEARSRSFDGMLLTDLKDLMPELRAFARQAGYKLVAERPFAGREEQAWFRSPEVAEEEKRQLVWDTLKGHCRLKRPRRVAIIGTSGKEHHWTVVSVVEDNRLKLWDSGASQRKGLSFEKCRYGYSVTDRKHHYLQAGEILLLELVER